MNKKQYEAMRKGLMDEAQALIDQGEVEKAQAKMKEIEDLDNKWDAIEQEQANYDALNKEPAQANPFGSDGESANFGAYTGVGANLGTDNEIIKAWESDNYKYAWAKDLMKLPMNAAEKEAFSMVNEAYTHTTGNTGVVIPKSVTAGIWEMAGEMYPYFEDISKTYVNGVLSMIQEGSSSDAGWYEEDTATDDGKETLKEYTLSGCELSRAITVSWKLREMAIDDFIPYIQRKMAKKMGAAAGYGATHGKGSTAVPGKPEPTGVVTALLAEASTPQVVEYANGTEPTWKDVTTARGKIKSGYGGGLKLYANSATIWNKVANITDKNGRAIFIPDPTTGGYRVLGMEVKEDDSMQDGEILMSNAAEGYHMNVNKEMSMTTEEHAKDRKTDYCGYAIMDGNALTTKAHALLKEAEAAK